MNRKIGSWKKTEFHIVKEQSTVYIGMKWNSEGYMLFVIKNKPTNLTVSYMKWDITTTRRCNEDK